MNPDYACQQCSAKFATYNEAKRHMWEEKKYHSHKTWMEQAVELKKIEMKRIQELEKAMLKQSPPGVEKECSECGLMKTHDEEDYICRDCRANH